MGRDQEGKVWLESLQHPDELEQLLKLAKLAKAKTMVEIGAGPCGTGVYFAKEMGDDGMVIAVDLPEEIGGTAPQYEAMARQTCPTWTMVRGDSGSEATKADVVRTLAGREIDVLFIDGEHTRACAERDYDLYRPLVSKDGIIAFHDITLPELWTMWCRLRGKRHPVRSAEFIDDRTRIGFGIGALVGRDEEF